MTIDEFLSAQEARDDERRKRYDDMHRVIGGGTGERTDIEGVLLSDLHRARQAIRVLKQQRDDSILMSYNWIVHEKNKSVVLRDKATAESIETCNAAVLAALEGKT